MTGEPIAAVYFWTSLAEGFSSEDLAWVTAYARALRHACAVQLFHARERCEGGLGLAAATGSDAFEIIGHSTATRQLTERLEGLLPGTGLSEAPPILVVGESGTGKELVARYIHRRSKKRSPGPFRAFNCAGLRGDLVEARLFGHSRGAFTGAVADSPGLFRSADRGTLFLDEVGELPPEGQALLLRAIETRSVQGVGDTKEVPVDVQIVLATNRNLEQEAAAGRFREDLYYRISYRISALVVEVAPLRDPSRLQDIREDVRVAA